nr:putative nucleotidyltransferase, ribonuclease H [Tanacetum cinerariifolium]
KIQKPILLVGYGLESAWIMVLPNPCQNLAGVTPCYKNCVRDRRWGINHKNREGSKHEGQRIHPTIGDFRGSYASNQSSFNDGRIEEWEEKKKKDRVSITKIFRSKILINNLVCSLIIDGCSINNLVLKELVDFLKLPMEICPVEGYQVCRVFVTIEKSYKVEVLCIMDDIDECHILLGKPWRLTPQLPKLEVKVEEKIMKAEVVKDHIEKIQDLQSYKQHDDKFLTLLFKATNKVGALKTCEENIGSTQPDVLGHGLIVGSVEVDEALNIENLKASSFQVRGINVNETKVNVVRDWSLPKTLLELPNEPYPSPYQIGYIKKGSTLKVIEICKVPLAIRKHYNELVTCDVIDIEACHKTIAMLSLSVISPKTKLENKTLETLVASP